VGVEKLAETGVPKKTSRDLRDKIISRRRSRTTYVITSAQNATPVHSNAWISLLTYCRVNNAHLLVIPYRYHNPTSLWSQKAKSQDWWAPEVLPFLINHRIKLNKHLLLLGDIMTQPTAVRPLEGFETISGSQSAIIGHPKLECTTVATPQSRLPKILTTTGSITKKNYIPSKAGKKGEFHHTFGATVVETEGNRFYMRQINMTSDGAFCDLRTEYNGTQIREYPSIPALVMGDTHVEVIDPQVVNAVFVDPDSMVNFLKPERLVWHDVFDGSSINHWDRGKTFHEYVKHHSGRRTAESEVNRTLAFIDSVTPPGVENAFVASNHNDFLREWVENTDPRKDPENAMFWAETFQAVCRSKDTRWTPSGVTVADPFAYWGMKRLKTAAQSKFLKRGESYLVCGIECGLHGDRGNNGARGSRRSFSKLGVKSISGHVHSPGIIDGAYQVGTSSRLNLTYAAGSPSSWLHTMCAIYPNGKRSLLHVIDGRWRP
jgi:hypothetical protein